MWLSSPKGAMLAKRSELITNYTLFNPNSYILICIPLKFWFKEGM